MNSIFETKATITVDESGEIAGLAWPFGSADRVGDMIEKGAFANAMLPLPMLASHNPADVVGTWTHVEETAEGLQVKGKLLVGEVARARELQALVNAGAIGGLSIGFTTKNSKIRAGGGRTITALDLVEISLVSIPCHPGARIRKAKAAANAIALAEAIQRAAAALSLR